MFVRYLSISLAVIYFAYLALDATENLERENKTRVIIITVESLRADMVTAANCPKLLSAAQNGYQFTNYRAASGWTGSNIVSLLSGLTPFESGVHTRGQSIDPTLHLPLKQLKLDGYKVAGLQPFMAMDIYRNLGLSVAKASPNPLLWIGKQKKSGQPFVLWYHYVHTHLPYTQNGKGPDNLSALNMLTQSRMQKVTKQSAIHFNEAKFELEDVQLVHDLHKNNIREFDKWFDSLWSFYNSGGFARDTILVVTADHGDEHGERQMVGHASTTLQGHLHEEIVRLPMFIWLPDRVNAVATFDQTSDKPASHIDVMPTILHLLGRKSTLPLTGKNLFSATDHDNWSGMTSSGGFAEPDPAAIRYFEYSHITDNWKSRWRIHRDRDPDEFHLYNLSVDPGELEDVASMHPSIVIKHKEILSPLIAQQVFRPVANESSAGEFKEFRSQPPQWRHPVDSTQISFADAGGRFFLEWSGSNQEPYQLQYKAGYGPKALNGTLEVDGNKKDFGTISKLYWKTWVIPNSPYRLRVKKVDGPWSNWIEIEAIP